MIVVSPIAAEESFVRVPPLECGPKAVEFVQTEILSEFPRVPASQAAYAPTVAAKLASLE